MNKTVYKLAHSFDDCPDPWKNMINILSDRERGKGRSWYEVNIQKIQEELENFNAIYIDRSSSHEERYVNSVEFKSEFDLLRFILIWS